jgi:hypothetical protein
MSVSKNRLLGGCIVVLKNVRKSQIGPDEGYSRLRRVENDGTDDFPSRF